MTAKDLERLVASDGGSVTALDTVTRKLRERYVQKPLACLLRGVRTGGRGPNAHRLNVFEAALVLLCYAGADVAERCTERLDDETFGGLVAVLSKLLHTPDALAMVEELRVGRQAAYAKVVLRHGPALHFGDQQGGGFRSEGILGGHLLKEVAGALRPARMNGVAA